MPPTRLEEEVAPSAVVDSTSVLASLGLDRYFLVPTNGRKHLDLAQFQPQPCRTLADFKALNPLLPISLLRVDRVGPVNDALFSRSHSYLGGVTFEKLLQLFAALPDTHHIFCSVVLEQRPVHLFFDIDVALNSPAEHGLTQALTAKTVEQVIDEFVRVFDAFFYSVFHRPADLSGMHWETACSPSKFSLHAHVITEAFVDVGHLNQFMRAFKAFIEARCTREGDSCLCARVPSEDAFVHLVDFAVYNRNRHFRLINCRKPGKTKLTYFSYMPTNVATSVGTNPTDEELLFRSMPSYSIAVRDELLSYTAPVMG